MAKLPSGVSAEVKAEFKTLAGTLKEAVKAQLLRIETLLVRQFRWPVPRWRGLYLAHPLLRPFTQRLVWGWRDAEGNCATPFVPSTMPRSRMWGTVRSRCRMRAASAWCTRWI